MTSQDCYRTGEYVRILSGDYEGHNGFVLYMNIFDPLNPKVCVRLEYPDEDRQTLMVAVKDVERVDEG